MRLYIHGAGRTGRAAWPHQNDDDAVFADFAPGTSVQQQVQHLTDIAPTEPAEVIAHSLGAVPAVLRRAC